MAQKQGYHHLQANSTNRGATPQPKVESSLDIASTPSSTNSRVDRSIHLYQESYSICVH